MTTRKSPMRKRPLFLVLDIETERFTSDFKQASTIADRLKYCPKIRLAGVYNSQTTNYAFYAPNQCSELIRVLLKADKLVTFNGNQFDLLVLQRHGDLSERRLRKIQGKHIDLYEVIRRETGRSFKLDQLARTNLNEAKMVNGREMSTLDTVELQKANRSDLSQTYRLWKLHQRRKLICPSYSRRSGFAVEVPDGPHSHLPFRDYGIYLDQNTEEMTDGQMAEYLAGTWGVTPGGKFVEM